MHLNRRSARDERGVVLILVCLSLVVLGMAAAMAIDLGNVNQLHRHAQFTVDDAAISGADLLEQGTDSLSQIVSATEGYIDENWGNVSGGWDSCASAPSGFGAPAGSTENCVTFNGTSTATATAISVELPPQPVPFTVARLGGFVSGSVGASATAVTVPGTSPCALCVLGTSATAPMLELNGSGAFTVTDAGSEAAGITDNSQGDPLTGVPAAEIIGGSGTITAPAIDLVGTAQGTGFHPTPVTGVSPVPDPLGDLAAPTPTSDTIPSACGQINSGNVNLGSTCGSLNIGGNAVVTIGPGNYSSISVGGSATLNLDPGMYFITGAFTVDGSSDTSDPPIVNGFDKTSGVLLYFTCGSTTEVTPCASSGQAGGSLSLTGKASMTLTSYTPSPPNSYTGLSIFYDRNNDSSITQNGTGELAVSGTIYAKSADLSLDGTGTTAAPLNSLIIVNSATISGTAGVSVNYDASQNATVSGTPYLCSTAANNC